MYGIRVAWLKLCAGEKKERRDGNTEITEIGTQSSQRRTEKVDPSTARRPRSAGAPVGMTLLFGGTSCCVWCPDEVVA